MTPLSSHAQIHSVSIIIYQKILHNIFKTLPLCRDEPEKKYFNEIIVV